MRTTLVLSLTLLLLTACTTPAPKPGNPTGLVAQVVNAKNHSAGIDLTLTLHNTTSQTMRLSQQSPVQVWLNEGAPIKGTVLGTVTLEPGERKTARLQFDFINMHKRYKSRLVEIYPVKIFKTCSAADADTTVVPDQGREVAGELQSDTCDRAMKDSIRIAF